MAINERGEFVRETPAPKEQKDPVLDLLAKREALLTQSVMPANVQKPADIFYWAPARLENNKALYSQMRRISTASGLSELVSPFSGERFELAPFLEAVRRSIEYSERINAQLPHRPDQ